MASPPAVLRALLLCVYAAVCPVWCECDNATQLAVQVDTLLAEYDREVPPAAKVSVQLTLDVRHASVDQQRSVMRLLADLKMTWEEPRVRWNATEWGCGSTLTSSARLWLPDVALLNAAGAGDAEPGLRARLDAAGAVSCVTRLDVAAPFTLALQDWPSDVQNCAFQFGSRDYTSDELELTISELKHAVVFESSAWEMVAVSGATWEQSRGVAQRGVAAWSVRVARRAPAQRLAAGAVSLCAALLLGAAAALPPRRRLALAACSSFITTLWLSTALLSVPAGAASPRGVRVACALCVCGAASALCAALVLRVARCSSTPPRALHATLAAMATFCKLTPPSELRTWAAAGALLDRAGSAAVLCALLVLLALQLLA